MKLTIFGLAFCVALAFAYPSYYEEDNQVYQGQQYEPYPEYEHNQFVRERRSPQQNPPPPPQPNRGSVSVTGGHTNGQGGFVRGDYDHKLWQGQNGARLDANTFYQRNFGSPGPRQDYGGGVKLSVPFGG